MKTSTKKIITLAASAALCTPLTQTFADTPQDTKTNRQLDNINNSLTGTNNLIQNALQAYTYSSLQHPPGDYYRDNLNQNTNRITQLQKNNKDSLATKNVNQVLQQFRDSTMPKANQPNSAADKNGSDAPPPAPSKMLSDLANIEGSDTLSLSIPPSQNPFLSYSTFMNNPIGTNPNTPFEYNNDQVKDYISLFTDPNDFSSAWLTNSAINTLKNDLYSLAQKTVSDPTVNGTNSSFEANIKNSNSDYGRFLQQLNTNPEFLAYKVSFRSAVAAYGMIVGTLTSMQQERQCGSAGCSSAPSPLAIQNKTDTWRVTDKNWHKYIATASSTSLQRELVQIEAQQLANQYQAHLDSEKTQALLALQSMLLLKQANAATAGKASQLKDEIDNIYKGMSPDEPEQDTASASNDSQDDSNTSA